MSEQATSVEPVIEARYLKALPVLRQAAETYAHAVAERGPEARRTFDPLGQMPDELWFRIEAVSRGGMSDEDLMGLVVDHAASLRRIIPAEYLK